MTSHPQLCGQKSPLTGKGKHKFKKFLMNMKVYVNLQIVTTGWVYSLSDIVRQIFGEKITLLILFCEVQTRAGSVVGVSGCCLVI